MSPDLTTTREKPSRKAVLEVAEDTGILIDEPVFMGRYARASAAYQIFVATRN